MYYYIKEIYIHINQQHSWRPMPSGPMPKVETMSSLSRSCQSTPYTPPSKQSPRTNTSSIHSEISLGIFNCPSNFPGLSGFALSQKPVGCAAAPHSCSGHSGTSFCCFQEGLIFLHLPQRGDYQFCTL